MRTLSSVLRHTQGASGAAVAALVVLLGTLVPVAAASASPKTAPGGTAAEKAHAVEKRSQLLQLLEAGASDQEIKSRIGLVKVSTDGVAPLSSNSEVTVYTPSVYYEPGPAWYYASADYRWNNQATTGDYYVGGLDGFAIRFSQDINNLGSSASICPGEWSGVRPYPSWKPYCLIPGYWESN